MVLARSEVGFVWFGLVWSGRLGRGSGIGDQTRSVGIAWQRGWSDLTGIDRLCFWGRPRFFLFFSPATFFTLALLSRRRGIATPGSFGTDKIWDQQNRTFGRKGVFFLLAGSGIKETDDLTPDLDPTWLPITAL